MGKKLKNKFFLFRKGKIKKIDETKPYSYENLVGIVKGVIDDEEMELEFEIERDGITPKLIKGVEKIDKHSKGKKTLSNKIIKFISEYTDIRDLAYKACLSDKYYKYSDYQNLISYGMIEREGIINDKKVLVEHYHDPILDKDFVIHYLVDQEVYKTWLDDNDDLNGMLDFDEDQIWMVQEVGFENV